MPADEFYSDGGANQLYRSFVAMLLGRVNTISGTAYRCVRGGGPGGCIMVLLRCWSAAGHPCVHVQHTQSLHLLQPLPPPTQLLRHPNLLPLLLLLLLLLLWPREDPTIFAWDLANEPRCEGDPGATILATWIENTAAWVKGLGARQPITVGLEGFFGPSTPGEARVWWWGGVGGGSYQRMCWMGMAVVKRLGVGHGAYVYLGCFTG